MILMNVAIDGPAGAGKSTISKGAAGKLGFIYVDTGALYRTIALNAIRRGVIDNEDEVIKMLDDTDVKLGFENGTQCVYLNGEEVSAFIRTPEISMGASKVSAIPKVREYLLDLQRDIAKKNNVIMDGRDIGTVVLPNAECKIFLTASVKVRAERRFRELTEKGESVSLEEVCADIEKRDYNDTHRAAAPLKRAEGACLADTSELSLDESVALVIKIISEGIKKS